MRKISLLILISFLLNTLCADSWAAAKITLGTTFSKRQCEYLELDWEETYLAILGLPLDIIRLGAYWNEIEQEENTYNFTDLDWQIKQARKRNIPVVLTIGMKAPRWPEYHIPEWVMAKTRAGLATTISNEPYLQEKVLQFIEKVTTRYRDEKIIRYWQVENEALNRFGGNFWRIDQDFLKKEIDLVRRLDTSHPILLTASTYPNAFLRFLSNVFTPGRPLDDNLALADILGINVYPIIGQKFLKTSFYYKTKQQGRLKYFKEIIERAQSQKKDIWITELQAEPWEPAQLVFKKETIPPTGWAEYTQLTLIELSSLGYGTFFFWGAEYWYYQKTTFKNPQWWQMIEKLLARYKGRNR